MGTYGRLGWIKRPGKRFIAIEALEKVGMREYSHRQISQLSGGQQQRVFLARALTQMLRFLWMNLPGVDAATERTITATKGAKAGRKNRCSGTS